MVLDETEPWFRFRLSIGMFLCLPRLIRSFGRVPMPDLSSARARNLALGLLAMTQFVVVIDASIINVALPSIGRALNISQDNLSWVVNSYTLTFGGFLLLGGRLADFFGRRRLFI